MADHNRAHAHNRSLPNGEALLDGCIDTKVGLLADGNHARELHSTGNAYPFTDHIIMTDAYVRVSHDHIMKNSMAVKAPLNDDMTAEIHLISDLDITEGRDPENLAFIFCQEKGIFTNPCMRAAAKAAADHGMTNHGAKADSCVRPNHNIMVNQTARLNDCMLSNGDIFADPLSLRGQRSRPAVLKDLFPIPECLCKSSIRRNRCI